MIYADNAATTQLDKEALEAMIPFLTEEYGNASQSYSFAFIEKKALKDARKTIANCINANPDEIFFTSGGTESDNWAIKKGCIVYGGDVVTSEIEHHAVLNACDAIKENGVNVKYLPVDGTGVVKLDEAERLIDSNTGLVSVMMANNEIGSIQPIKKLVRIAHERNALFHTDAVQTTGHISIDVKDLGVDMLSSSAHKFNGPKGIGFLYVKKGIKLKPYMDGGAQEDGLRAGTENVAAIVGMAVALRKNVDRISEYRKKMKEYESIFIDELNCADIDYKLNGNRKKIPGNINISIKDIEGEVLLHRLDLKGIYVSTGSACDSVNTQISHVIKAIKVDDLYAEGTIRISLGVNNTEEEVIEIARNIIVIVKQNCNTG